MPIGIWAAALEALRPHAAWLGRTWSQLVAAVDTGIRIPVAQRLVDVAGRGKVPRPCLADSYEACMQLPQIAGQASLGSRITCQLLEELGIMVSPDTPWVMQSRDEALAASEHMAGITPSGGSRGTAAPAVAVVGFSFSARTVASATNCERQIHVLPTQRVLRAGPRTSGTLEAAHGLPFLGLAASDTKSTAESSEQWRGDVDSSALIEACAALLSAVGGGPPAEWRAAASGSSSTSAAVAPGVSENCSASLEGEEYLLLAPNGFPCPMTELRIFQSSCAVGYIRLYCGNQAPGVKAMLLLVQIARLFPQVVLEVSFDSATLQVAVAPAAALRPRPTVSRIPSPVGLRQRNKSSSPSPAGTASPPLPRATRSRSTSQGSPHPALQRGDNSMSVPLIRRWTLAPAPRLAAWQQSMPLSIGSTVSSIAGMGSGSSVAQPSLLVKRVDVTPPRRRSLSLDRGATTLGTGAVNFSNTAWQWQGGAVATPSGPSSLGRVCLQQQASNARSDIRQQSPPRDFSVGTRAVIPPRLQARRCSSSSPAPPLQTY